MYIAYSIACHSVDSTKIEVGRISIISLTPLFAGEVSCKAVQHYNEGSTIIPDVGTAK